MRKLTRINIKWSSPPISIFLKESRQFATVKHQVSFSFIPFSSNWEYVFQHQKIHEIFLKVQLFGKYNIVQHGIVHVEIILKLKILNIIALNVIYFSCNAKKKLC